jgi:hypothetical protein
MAKATTRTRDRVKLKEFFFAGVTLKLRPSSKISSGMSPLVVRMVKYSAQHRRGNNPTPGCKCARIEQSAEAQPL